MMKKRLSILIILLTNILLLVHVLVPHHHNKIFVAVVNVLDNDTQDLFNPELGHEHHHDCDKEDCMMNDAVAAAALKIQTDDGSDGTIMPQWDNEDVLQIWLAAIALYESSFTLDKEENFRPFVYAECGHTDFIACCKGLRAPPIC